MKRCDECKHWDRSGLDEETNKFSAGVCSRLKPLWDRSFWNEEGDRELLPEAANDLAWAQDGSDYHAIVLTRPEFYCAHYEKK